MRTVLAYLLLSACPLLPDVIYAQWTIPFNRDFKEAILHDDTTEVTAFLDKQKDLNARQGDGTTFLQEAAYWGKTNAVRLLLDRGVNISLADTNGMTALHYAVIFNGCEMGSRASLALQSGKRNACELLLQHRAEVAVRDKDGNLPLHWILHPHFHAPPVVAKDICDALLDRGADINATNTVSETALHLAVKYRFPANVCGFLLAKGAKINARDDSGKTPLHLAMFPRSAEPDLDDMKTLCEVLVDAKADTDAQDTDGNTPLHWAAGQGFVVLCKTLLVKGADPMIRNSHGETALTTAEKLGKAECVRLLRQFTEKEPNRTSEPSVAPAPQVQR